RRERAHPRTDSDDDHLRADPRRHSRLPARVRATLIFFRSFRFFVLILSAVLLLFFCARTETSAEEVFKMVARQPQLRRRGFFLHSSEGGEPDTGEHEK